jgi:quinol monooxygenase YgiN
MNEVKVVIRYSAKEGMDEQARKELQELVSLVVEKEADCLGIEILQEASDPNQFLLYERWTSKEAYLGDHMQTPYILSFIERAKNIFSGPPEITFWNELT